MEVLSFDFSTLASAGFAILLGTFVGMLAGALPGLGAMVAIVLLLPITYNMSALNSILLLLATYQAAEYGGSISSITLGIPGTPAAAATVMDGYPLAKQKSPGKALGYSLAASTIGGVFGALVLVFLSAPMASFALKLSEPEFFLIGILGLLGVASLSSHDKWKSAISVILGLMAGTIGMDQFTGALRFTAGSLSLMDGLSIIAMVTGLFAITEILSMVNGNLNQSHRADSQKIKVSLSVQELKEVSKPTLIGSVIGTVIGIFPGLGPGAASWFSYATAKRFSKSPETFGKGNPEGIAAAEASNNASVGGSLLPLLTLGIPGSAAIAVIMGAFIIHGIQPGPQVLAKEPVLVYGIFVGFFLTTVAMYLVGRMLTPVFGRVLSVPGSVLVPVILVLSIIGVYASKGSYFDIWIALGIGIVAYLLKKLDFSIPSFVLAFILCPLIETSLRRSLILSSGSYSIFFTRPYSLLILLIIAALVAMAIMNAIKQNKQKNFQNMEKGV
ncbi:tripartite tricarboxylate transporter permease [Ammoniphilus sp. YIM 78166]|uniref:tripartite tricarboxylate transporter permease n=1 Tax=Ammoniphilus sp. YIM 78166 TaxID=1644106 RepID=UPI001430607B|nr:tripartite tricarboxylate transporter permease [Ammoniphilus sp. YIM 78166]